MRDTYQSTRIMLMQYFLLRIVYLIRRITKFNE